MAVVAGASSGIGYEEDGEIEEAAKIFRSYGVDLKALRTNLTKRRNWQAIDSC